MSLLLETSVPALCAWRENRGGGKVGMQSVLNVLANRAALHQSSLYAQAVQPDQFTSICPPLEMQALDSEADVWPDSLKEPIEYALYVTAEQMAVQAIAGELPDITGRAVNYYAQSMAAPPAWAAKMTQTAVIAGQVFFK